MADHSELVSEMTLLEKMSTQERLKLARKRRIQQLKKWNQKEKEFATKRKKNPEKNTDSINGRKVSKMASGCSTTVIGPNRKPRDISYKVHFVPSVMLLEAAARNDIEEVRRLLMLSVSPDSTNEDGLTALHQCCIDDSEEMMKLLIEFGANVNAKDSEQWTPLHAAATCGHLHLVKYLITKNADLLSVNADGNMPYDICEDESTLDYIESEMAKKGVTQDMIDETRSWTENQMLNDLKSLMDHSEDLEFRDTNGATPLHIASANGYLSVVEFLLDNHVSTDVVDNDLWQPVHAAACWGHPDVLEVLVQSGADLEARTKNGESPLDICEDPELKERIVQLKSEMETKRNSSQTNRLKRSHSSNTRTQSVRRTSIREKSQISRREAKLEAKMRSQASNDKVPVETDTDTDGGSGGGHGDTMASVSEIGSKEMPDLLKSTPVMNVSKKESPVAVVPTQIKSVIDVNGSTMVETSFDTNQSQNVRFLSSSEKKENHSTINCEQPSSSKVFSSSSSSSQVSTTTVVNNKNSNSNNSSSHSHKEQSSAVAESYIKGSSKFTDNQTTESKNVESNKICSSDERKNQRVKSKNSSNNVIKNPGYSDVDTSSGNTKSDTIVGTSSVVRETEVVGNSLDCGSIGNSSPEKEKRKSSGESVKVEIHVTVNTGSSPTTSTNSNCPLGTLADLKKQRTERRGSDSRNSLANGDTMVDTNPDTSVDTVSQNNNHNQTIRRSFVVVDTPTMATGHGNNNCLLVPPPSPSRPNIFRGNEIVGGNGNQSKQGCCTIS